MRNFKMSKVYTCELIQDPDDPNELAIDLPDELLLAPAGSQVM